MVRNQLGWYTNLLQFLTYAAKFNTGGAEHLDLHEIVTAGSLLLLVVFPRISFSVRPLFNFIIVLFWEEFTCTARACIVSG